MPNFSIPWNTAASANGTHTIYAVVRDYSGNTVTTSTITVTAANDEPSTDPIVPADPPNDVPGGTPTTPAATVVNSIPLGVLFYNTLGEFSTFNAGSIFPSAIDPNLEQGILNDDYLDVQRDYAVVGDGSNETTKIQAALDQAAANAAAGSGKTKVLIPSSVDVCVGPAGEDLCDGFTYGYIGYCLFVDSGVTVRIDGKIRACYEYTSTLDNTITIFETRNSFVGGIPTRDNSIVFEGNGVIDLEGIYLGNTFTTDTSNSPAKNIVNVWALRAYKVDKLTVKDITIKHGTGEKMQIGFSSFVNIENVKFDTALKYADFSGATDTAFIQLDVCDGYRVHGCIAKDCAVYKGIGIWASKNGVISENNFSDLISGDGSLSVFARGNAIWFVDYGMEFIDLDMAFDQEIYDLNAGLEVRTLIINNFFCRNGSSGIELFGGNWQNSLTGGFTVQDNKICSNAIHGIYYDGLKHYDFSNNEIGNNGWGTPLAFD